MLWLGFWRILTLHSILIICAVFTSVNECSNMHHAVNPRCFLFWIQCCYTIMTIFTHHNALRELRSISLSWSDRPLLSLLTFVWKVWQLDLLRLYSIWFRSALHNAQYQNRNKPLKPTIWCANEYVNARQRKIPTKLNTINKNNVKKVIWIWNLFGSSCSRSKKGRRLERQNENFLEFAWIVFNKCQQLVDEA